MKLHKVFRNWKIFKFEPSTLGVASFWEQSLDKTSAEWYYFLFFFILGAGVTEEEKRLILEEHNFLRQTVATGHVR